VAVDFAAYDVLTFDCYGTLIDWETGLLAALREALPGSVDVGDDALL
jgi:2-haloacid dehalogenase